MPESVSPATTVWPPPVEVEVELLVDEVDDASPG